ncbi:hypothetical protein CAPTEDRAFT_222259 [Capitella teleta]|uniref:Mitochondrial nucleoid factor 1 n=1 Tax=Capitella teleta TaxID=283909 RepID=R7TBZ9_CAPTE|nr:hypothetical protein CAPTEDRAFT_222259 [Capitella teleta]|eukprot:ELT91234.1 hypothetical protein CAPTEDRAFT_222259 [Capitella teleta]
MASYYKKFTRLIELWPTAKYTLPGSKDLGVHIRERVLAAFPNGTAGNIDTSKCDNIHDSLQRLAVNTYAKSYERDFTNTAFGLTREEIREKFDELAEVEEESNLKKL